MDKMGYARGLIRYSTENAVKGKYPDQEIKKHVVRPRVLIYTGLLVLVM
jgi:polyferredoxin